MTPGAQRPVVYSLKEWSEDLSEGEAVTSACEVVPLPEPSKRAVFSVSTSRSVTLIKAIFFSWWNVSCDTTVLVPTKGNFSLMTCLLCLLAPFGLHLLFHSLTLKKDAACFCESLISIYGVTLQKAMINTLIQNCENVYLRWLAALVTVLLLDRLWWNLLLSEVTNT